MLHLNVLSGFAPHSSVECASMTRSYFCAHSSESMRLNSEQEAVIVTYHVFPSGNISSEVVVLGVCTHDERASENRKKRSWICFTK